MAVMQPKSVPGKPASKSAEDRARPSKPQSRGAERGPEAGEASDAGSVPGADRGFGAGQSEVRARSGGIGAGTTRPESAARVSKSGTEALGEGDEAVGVGAEKLGLGGETLGVGADEVGFGGETMGYSRALEGGPSVSRVQEALGEAGFEVAADGRWGPQTRQALHAFQARSGLTPSGELDVPTIEALGLAPKAATEPEPAPSTAAMPTVRPHAIGDQAIDDVRDDRLGFEPYVEALVRFLRAEETQPPLAIAVRAPWGRGKTSFMRMVDGQLDATRFATTWFNPWKYKTREELWTAYLETITRCIRERLGWWKRAELWVRRYLSDLEKRGQVLDFSLRFLFFAALLLLFAWLAFGVGITTLTSTLVDAVFEPRIAEAIRSTLGGVLLGVLGFALVIYLGYVHVVQKFDLGLMEYLRVDPSRQSIASLSQFENELGLLAEAKPADIKIVILIDDLDRCEPEILWEVMVAQQLLELSSKCIFIIAMDQDIVTRTLSAELAKHSQPAAGSAAWFEHGLGYQFLEKIIQARISIPAHDGKQMLTFVEGLMPHCGTRTGVGAPPGEVARSQSPENETPRQPPTDDDDEDSEELRRAIVDYGPTYFDNPRRLKRYVNALRLYTYLAGASQFEVAVDQLARFLVLTECWPGLIPQLLESASWMETVFDPDAVPSDHWPPERIESFQRLGVLTQRDDLRRLFQSDPPIDHERLRELCQWYGFRFHGEGGG